MQFADSSLFRAASLFRILIFCFAPLTPGYHAEDSG